MRRLPRPARRRAGGWRAQARWTAGRGCCRRSSRTEPVWNV